jgi:hypothetical protein
LNNPFGQVMNRQFASSCNSLLAFCKSFTRPLVPRLAQREENLAL